MKEPYGEAVATRTDPEPWWDGRKGVLQASVGERAGWVLSREKEEIGASRPSKRAEDNTAEGAPQGASLPGFRGYAASRW